MDDSPVKEEGAGDTLDASSCRCYEVAELHHFPFSCINKDTKYVVVICRTTFHCHYTMNIISSPQGAVYSHGAR